MTLSTGDLLTMFPGIITPNALNRWRSYGWLMGNAKGGSGYPVEWADWTPRMVRLIQSYPNIDRGGTDQTRYMLRIVAGQLAMTPDVEWVVVSCEEGRAFPVDTPEEAALFTHRSGGTMTIIAHLS